MTTRLVLNKLKTAPPGSGVPVLSIFLWIGLLCAGLLWPGIGLVEGQTAAHTNLVNSQLVGTWSSHSGQSNFTLVLNAGGSGALNELELRWEMSGGNLSFATSKGNFRYRASQSGDSLTLYEGGLKRPLTFERVKLAESADLFNDTGELPIAGNPPLTQELVDKGIQFFEWLLDAQLTVEQRAEFRESMVRSWKGHRQDEIDGTVNVLKFQDQLVHKSPEERGVIRQQLRDKFLASMQQTPNAELSRWVLNIYDSAHRPIANGNPPLTSQVADAYAEFVSFMVTESLGNTAFKVDRHFKDALAQGLAAQYLRYSPGQQKQLSQLPLLWEVLRLKWSQLSEPEREAYRKQWAPSAKILVSGATAGNATSQAKTAPSSGPGSLDDYLSHSSERIFVKSMIDSSFQTTLNIHLSMMK